MRKFQESQQGSVEVEAAPHGVDCGRFAVFAEEDVAPNRGSQDETVTTLPVSQAGHKWFPLLTIPTIRAVTTGDFEKTIAIYVGPRSRHTETGVAPRGQGSGMFVPRACFQRWSPVNVPLMWGAAGSSGPAPAAFDHLMSMASRIRDPVDFHDNRLSAVDALTAGWVSLRAVLRTWGIQEREHFTAHLRRQGFPPPLKLETTCPSGHRRFFSQRHVKWMREWLCWKNKWCA